MGLYRDCRVVRLQSWPREIQLGHCKVAAVVEHVGLHWGIRRLEMYLGTDLRELLFQLATLTSGAISCIPKILIKCLWEAHLQADHYISQYVPYNRMYSYISLNYVKIMQSRFRTLLATWSLGFLVHHNDLTQARLYMVIPVENSPQQGESQRSEQLRLALPFM